MNVSIRCVVLFLAPIAALHASSFQNLNFESASVASAPASYTPWDAYDPISAASALPFWTVEEDNTGCNAVWRQPVALDETSVALVGAKGTQSDPQSGTPIQGKYSVALSSNPQTSGSGSPYFSFASIAQTGNVPVQAKSIVFLMEGAYGPAPLVTLGGTPINLIALSDNNNVYTMAGDISEFAGQNLELKFLCQGTGNRSVDFGESGFELDNISFSTVAIPEPSSYAALIAGTALVGTWIFRRTIKRGQVSKG